MPTQYLLFSASFLPCSLSSYFLHVHSVFYIAFFMYPAVYFTTLPYLTFLYFFLFYEAVLRSSFGFKIPLLPTTLPPFPCNLGAGHLCPDGRQSRRADILKHASTFMTCRRVSSTPIIGPRILLILWCLDYDLSSLRSNYDSDRSIYVIVALSCVDRMMLRNITCYMICCDLDMYIYGIHIWVY